VLASLIVGGSVLDLSLIVRRSLLVALRLPSYDRNEVHAVFMCLFVVQDEMVKSWCGMEKCGIVKLIHRGDRTIRADKSSANSLSPTSWVHGFIIASFC
jgi:hypothetical protein